MICPIIQRQRYYEINFVNHEILHKIKTGYTQTGEGGVNSQYKSNKKQKMGTYAVNIYGWDPTLICLYICSFYFMQNFVVYEINFEYLIGISVFSSISSNFEGVTKE
jgi:hypothetical protein